MDEPHGSLAKLVSQVARRDLAAVHLPAKEAVTRDSVDRAISEKSTFDAGVGPIESINADCFFSDCQAEATADRSPACRFDASGDQGKFGVGPARSLTRRKSSHGPERPHTRTGRWRQYSRRIILRTPNPQLALRTSEAPPPVGQGWPAA